MTDPNFISAVEKSGYRYDHPPLIYALMRCLRVKSAIEIGCHIGYASCWMARAIQENEGTSLYCIDPFCWVNEDQEKLWNEAIQAAGVSGHASLIKGRSEEVEWPQAEFVFVDGNHTYPVAKHDAEKARDMGAICVVLHDTVAWDGSRLHADEVRTDPAWDGWDKLEVVSECGMTILLKRGEKPVSWGHDIGEQWDKPNQ